MSEFAIKVENLSKQYRIGLKEERYKTITGSINSFIKSPLTNYRKIRSLKKFDDSEGANTIWALKDLNFEIKEGEAVGIIGRNGAGKSTLLKVLSRITQPTCGRITLYGRVASLLEVGTGFNPELTGRENIYLNGTILGMSRREIDKKFDEIVSFSGVEKFIDTPVKRYSSGMYVRLAFAVAAHLDPEILVIDEVLAVGDAEFQKKCLGKMEEVAKGGRTVLFVSHNMAALNAFCTRSIVLEKGIKVFEGNIVEGINFYQNSTAILSNNITWENEEEMPGNKNIRIKSLGVSPLNGTHLDIDSGVKFSMVFKNYLEKINLDVTFELYTFSEVCVFHTGCLVCRNKDSKIGEYEVEGFLSPKLLNSGYFKINIIVGENQKYVLYRIKDILSFEIGNTGTNKGNNLNPLPGIIFPDMNWKYQYLNG